uniref:Uncharacterized protein n=1 Tax=Fervidobacterium thailandense TaxID=1008305 RepID=A0A7C4GHS2_9BACT
MRTPLNAVAGFTHLRRSFSRQKAQELLSRKIS